MIITIEEFGRKRVITDAIAYDVLCTDDIDNTAKILGVRLTEEQKDMVARCCQRAEHFPNMEDLADIIRDVVNMFYN